MNNLTNWGIVLFVFLAAALFRLTFLNLIEFKLDEARDVYEMEVFWQHPYFPERGTIESTGVYNPPLWYYILALISLPSRDPQYLSFIIGLINSLAVAGFYLVLRRWYGQGVALAASLLLAFSPWNILFSRKIWAPDLILPLTVGWFYFLHSVVIPAKAGIYRDNLYGSRIESGMTGKEKSVKWAWFGLVLVLGLLAQLHASGIFLAGATLIALIALKILHLPGVKAHPGGVKFALLGLLVSFVFLIPYLVFQVNNGCPDCRTFLEYRGGDAGEPLGFDTNAFLRPFQFIGGSGWSTVLGPEGYQDILEQYSIVKFINFIFILEFALLPLGVWYVFRGIQDSFHLGGAQAHPRCVLLLIGILVLVPLLYLITQTPAHLYYFLIISPIVILLYSFGIINLGGSGWLGFGWLSITLISLTILINIIFEAAFYKYLMDIRVVPGDYGATFGVIKEMTEEKLAEYKDRPDYNLIKAEFWVKLFSTSQY